MLRASPEGGGSVGIVTRLPSANVTETRTAMDTTGPTM